MFLFLDGKLRSALRLLSKLIFVAGIGFTIYGCNTQNLSNSAADSYTAGYTQSVRWDQGEPAIREDIQTYLSKAPLQNQVGIYLEKNGAICGSKKAFPAHMSLPGSLSSLGDSKVFCFKDGYFGIDLIFEQDAGKVRYSDIHFFPPFANIPVEKKKEYLAKAVEAVPPVTLFRGSSGDVRQRFDLILNSLEYDQLLPSYLKENLGFQCAETALGSLGRIEGSGQACRKNDIHVALQTDLAGRELTWLRVMRSGKQVFANSYGANRQKLSFRRIEETAVDAQFLKIRENIQATSGAFHIRAASLELPFGSMGHAYALLEDDNGNIVMELHGFGTDANEVIRPVGSNADDRILAYAAWMPMDFTNETTLSNDKITINQTTALELLECLQLQAVIFRDREVNYSLGAILATNTGGRIQNSNTVAATLAKCFG